MTWTRISDDFPDRPEVLRVSRSARLLHIEAQVYSNKHGTDGRILHVALPRISDSPDLESDTDELAESGLWQRTSLDEWLIDMRDQESAADVRSRRESNAARQKRYRDRKARHDSGDHADCDARFCRSVTRNATRSETGRVTTPLPTPTRPRPKERGRGLESAPRCPGGFPFSGDDGVCGCGEGHQRAAS